MIKYLNTFTVYTIHIHIHKQLQEYTLHKQLQETKNKPRSEQNIHYNTMIQNWSRYFPIFKESFFFKIKWAPLYGNVLCVELHDIERSIKHKVPPIRLYSFIFYSQAQHFSYNLDYYKRFECRLLDTFSFSSW